jgi:hypothetical protein
MLTQRASKYGKSRCRLSTARVVKMKSRKEQTPISQHTSQVSVRDVRQNVVFRHEGEACSSWGFALFSFSISKASSPSPSQSDIFQTPEPLMAPW